MNVCASVVVEHKSKGLMNGESGGNENDVKTC